MEKALLSQFKEKGYCLVSQGLPIGLLQTWRRLADEIELKALECHSAGQQYPGAGVIEDNTGAKLVRFDDISGIDAELVFATLASPHVLDIAKSIVGRDCVPVNMDLLYKHPHPFPAVNWHQDAPVKRDYPYITMGIYLDDAPSGDACLRYVPGTQHSVCDVEKLAKDYGWDIPGTVEQPAVASDILVHDAMVLHGCQPKISKGIRRTLYVELRSLKAITNSKHYSKEWIQLRRQWMSKIISKDKAGIWPVEWKSDHLKTEYTATLLRDIVQKQEPGIKANWGIFPVETEDYPVPAELK